MNITILLPAVLLTLASQENDDPTFKYWSAWKVGAWVRSKAEVEMVPGNKVEVEMTSKLLEVSADKVMIERSGKMNQAGQDIPLPTEKAEIKPANPNFGKISKEGDEEIEIAGKKLKCHWILTTQEDSKSKVTTKFWFTSDIPGGLAKCETTGKAGTTGTIRIQTVAWGER